MAVELGGANVVEEEERLGALHEDVVHAVVDKVFANGAMALGQAGHFELGAYAVR